MHLTYLIGISTSILIGYFIYLYLIAQYQFYPACVRMMKNRKSMALIFLTGNIYAITLYRICLRIMFGPFRLIETEYLNRRCWRLFRELASIFTYFQPIFSMNTYIRYIFLYYFTLTHFVLAKRIELINQTLNFSTIRLILALFVILFCNIILLITNLNIGISMINVLFLSRYILCFTMILKCIIDYCLNLIDNVYFNNDWPMKSIYNELITLLTTALNTLTYLATWFMMILFGYRSISIFHYTIKSLERFLLVGQNLIRTYQTWIRMQEFDRPDENEFDPEEFCPICLEPMLRLANVLKAINCRHIYHYECLKRWIFRQQYCPLCRTTF